MRDHKDITEWATMPTLMLPAGFCRPLGADECLAKAEENERLLEACVDPQTSRYLRREIKGWRRLAAARA